MVTCIMIMAILVNLLSHNNTPVIDLFYAWNYVNVSLEGPRDILLGFIEALPPLRAP